MPLSLSETFPDYGKVSCGPEAALNSALPGSQSGVHGCSRCLAGCSPVT